MAEDQSRQQGSEPGYVVMTPEDVVLLSKKAAEEAVNRYRSQADNGDGDNLIGLDGKFVKQLQNTVGVFNALKDFSSSPLQKVVEEKVGQFAAGMVESAFSGPRSPEKKNIIETILNSQFAYGLGASLGNKSPELIEAMSRNLGREQTQHIIDNVITKGTQGQGHTNVGQGAQQDNVELLLSLDPNNPEHIAAYSESQGGLPPDVARKMLMIHQDAIIKRFGDQGANVQKAGTGQKAQSPSSSTRPQSRAPIVEQVPKSTPEESEPMQYTNYDEFPSENVTQRNDVTQPNVQEQSPGGGSNSEMLDVMRKFSSDVGQAMSAMIEEMSTLKGTVSQLRGEIDTIRSNRPMQPGMQDPIAGQSPIMSRHATQQHVVPPPVSTQIKREYVPPVTPSPVAQSMSSQQRVVSYQSRVDPVAERYEDIGLGKQENGLIEQEPEKSLEEIMDIREHRMTSEELTDIKPKEVVQQPMQSEIPTNVGPDVKWTDEDLAKDIINMKKAKESDKLVSKPKNITEELIKVAEENKVTSDIEKAQKTEGVTEHKEIVNIEEKRPIVNIEEKRPIVNIEEKRPIVNIEEKRPIVNIEEKRPIVPIKRSEIYKKIKPSIKKVENG